MDSHTCTIQCFQPSIPDSSDMCLHKSTADVVKLTCRFDNCAEYKITQRKTKYEITFFKGGLQVRANASSRVIIIHKCQTTFI